MMENKVEQIGTAKIAVEDGPSADFPVLTGSMGQPAIDVRALSKAHRSFHI